MGAQFALFVGDHYKKGIKIYLELAGFTCGVFL